MQAIIDVSDSILMALNEKKDDFLVKMKIFTAVAYFKEEKLSLGKAAALAGMNKIRISSKLYDVALKKVNAPPAKELFLSQTFARASAYNEILLEELL